MACDRGLVAVGQSDGNIEIRDITFGERVRGWKGHHNAVGSLVFTSDQRLVSGSHDGFVKRWDLKSLDDVIEVWSRDVGVGVYEVSELADGRLVVGGQGASVWVLDGVTGHEIMACMGHIDWVRAVIPLETLDAGSPKGILFASGSMDMTIRLWDFALQTPEGLGFGTGDGTLVPQRGSLAARVVEVEESVYSLSLSPCGQFVAAGCGDGYAKLYRIPRGPMTRDDGSNHRWGQVWSVKACEGSVMSISWSPGGKLLASGSPVQRCPTVKIISAATGATLRTLGAPMGHTGSVTSVLFSDDGTKVLSGSRDTSVRVWRIFWPTERRVRALCAGLAVDERTDFEKDEKDALCEVVRRTKRLWEAEAE